MDEENQNEDSLNNSEEGDFHFQQDNIQNNDNNINKNNNQNLSHGNINLENISQNYNSPGQDGNENNIEYNDIEEDEYMNQLYINLAKIRKERKEAQDNAKLLDNRLNLLKKEEKRELIKLEITKNKANNKLLRLYEISENNKIIEKVKKNKNDDIEIKRNRIKKMNEEMEKKVKKMRPTGKSKLKILRN